MEQVSRENFTVVMKWPQTSSVFIANFVTRELLLIESAQGVPQSMVCAQAYTQWGAELGV